VFRSFKSGAEIIEIIVCEAIVVFYSGSGWRTAEDMAMIFWRIDQNYPFRRFPVDLLSDHLTDEDRKPITCCFRVLNFLSP
jgi:hypothetical protein